MRDRFSHYTMAAICLTFVVVSVVGMRITRLYFDPHQLAWRAALLGVMVGLLFGVAAYAGRRGAESLKNLAIILAWTFVIGEVHVIPMFAIVRTGVPLRDDLLARADRAIGADVPAVMEWMGRHPGLRVTSGFCYGSLYALCLLPSIIPPLLGDAASARRFIVACVTFAVISYPIMASFQAVGPWAYYGYRPQINQDGYMAMFAELRTSHDVLLDFEYRSGLICFLSFHTAIAVLSAAALWSTPYLRWVAATWAALIAVSTVTTGSHYVVDVVAALALCLAAQWVAQGYGVVEARITSPS